MGILERSPPHMAAFCGVAPLTRPSSRPADIRVVQALKQKGLADSTAPFGSGTGKFEAIRGQSIANAGSMRLAPSGNADNAGFVNRVKVVGAIAAPSSNAGSFNLTPRTPPKP